MRIQDLLKKRSSDGAKSTPGEKRPRRKLLSRLLWGAAIAVPLVIVLMGAGTWFSTGMLLSPTFEGLGKGFATCKPDSEKLFGKACGNLRDTHEFVFSEVSIPSLNGYKMPGWLIRAADNGKAPAKGAIMLVHAGGSDRREDTRHVGFYLNQGLDVLTFDLGCAGEAPCPVKGMSYGQRESRDVLSAYLYSTETYDKVYAMGASVGAASILIALPEMPKLSGVIAEDAYTSFDRLVKEAPESKAMPAWAANSMIGLAMARGNFDGLLAPEHSLQLTKTTPIFFIHSKEDKVISYKQTQDLADLYKGPKTVWFSEKGEHALVWNADRTAYEKRVADFLSSVRELAMLNR